jgi:hypothetical protein
MNDIYAHDFPSLGYVSSKISDDLYQSLLKECLQAQEKNERYETGLTGPGVAKAFFIKDKKNLINFNKFIGALIDAYDRNYPSVSNNLFRSIHHHHHIKYNYGKPWINFQKPGEYIPNHIHDGIFSYALWMKIPYELKEEEQYEYHKDNKSYSVAKFQFSFSDALGYMNTAFINVSKKDEGSIILFPAKINHIVYPFYKSKENRISISGNILVEAV